MSHPHHLSLSLPRQLWNWIVTLWTPQGKGLTDGADKPETDSSLPVPSVGTPLSAAAPALFMNLYAKLDVSVYLSLIKGSQSWVLQKTKNPFLSGGRLNSLLNHWQKHLL